MSKRDSKVRETGELESHRTDKDRGERVIGARQKEKREKQRSERETEKQKRQMSWSYKV